MERTGSLEVLPAGSAVEDPDEVGFDRAMGRIIQRLRGRADIVLVDASPLLRSDTIALSAHVDAIVVVARLKGLRSSELEEMGWMLEAAPAAKLGFIVTGARGTPDTATGTVSSGNSSRRGRGPKRALARPARILRPAPTGMARRPLGNPRRRPVGPSGV